MDVYCDINVKKALFREFPYVFSDNKYPGVPEVNIHQINSNKSFNNEFGNSGEEVFIGKSI